MAESAPRRRRRGAEEPGAKPAQPEAPGRRRPAPERPVSVPAPAEPPAATAQPEGAGDPASRPAGARRRSSRGRRAAAGPPAVRAGAEGPAGQPAPPQPPAGARRRSSPQRPAAQPAEAAAGELTPGGEPAGRPDRDAAGAGPRHVPPVREAAAATLYERVWRTGLLTVLAVARKELGTYFVSPIGYVVAVLMIPLVAYTAYLPPLSFQSPVSMGNVYYYVIFFSVFAVPLFTMRLLAEERRHATLELLLTSPVRDWELVVGKWLGSFVFYVAATAFVLVLAGLLAYYQPTHQVVTVFGIPMAVGNLDLGPVFAGYLGMLLAGGMFLAVGILASSLTHNQIVAGFIGVVALVFLFFLLGLGAYVRPPYSDFIQYLAANGHWTSFEQGRIVLKDVVYYLSVTVAALFVTTRLLESRRWR